MRTSRKRHILTLHFDKPIEKLSAREIESIWQRAKEWGNLHNCSKIVLQTSKKQNYHILNLICSKEPEIEED